MNASSRIYVAGHRGMVGSAICRALQAAGLPAPVTFTSAELDLRDQSAVQAMMAREKPTHVFLAAAKVGGIHANNNYASFDFVFVKFVNAVEVKLGSMRSTSPKEI